jgi:hypothetical protein
MTDDDIFCAVVDALEASGVPYMLVGSFTTNYYGVPRATHDLDIVIEFDALDLASLLTRLGSGFRVEPQMSFETITATQRHVLRVVGSSFTIELFAKSHDEHDRLRFNNRRRARMLGRDSYIPAAEDVIITKLRWAKIGNRTKDTEDLANVIAVRGKLLDWEYIHRWCEVHGTRALLDEIRTTVKDV